MKYEFANVLVADTRLQMNMSEPENYPRVLVLNNHLNSHDNCLRQSQTVCANCCLRIEEPEFKKRTQDEDEEDEDQTTKDQQQCFANCSSERRFVNIELNTESQIHGKLVLLALTKGIPNALMMEGSSASLKCQTETSWFYSLFDRPQLNQSNDKVVASSGSSSSRKLTHYSRFKSNQLASMRISSLEINWNNKLRREVVSIDIQSPGRSSSLKKEQQQQQQQQQRTTIYTNETLLVSELSCRLSSNLDSVAWLGKIHLLALINREVNRTNYSSTIRPRGSQRKGTSDRPASKRDTIQTPSATTPISAISSIGRTTEDDDRPAATDDSQNSVDIDRRSSDFLNPRNSNNHNTLNQSGLSSFMMDGATGSNLAPAPAGTNHHPIAASGNNRWTSTDLNNQLHSPIVETTATGGGGGSGLSESIRMRLKSSSFLLFTISSSFVILAYTLCLLIYLKGRSKKPISGGGVRSRRLPNQTSAPRIVTATATVTATPEEGERQMCISEPYNLQMPEPTRTRLDMMLRSSSSSAAAANNNNNKRMEADVALTSGQQWQQHHLPTVVDDQDRRSRRKRRHSYQDANILMDGGGGYCNPVSGCAGMQGTTCIGACIEQEPLYHIAGGSGHCLNSGDFGYGTLQVVKAIRQAADVARVKLRSSRYEPNLNVIHESDVEHLTNHHLVNGSKQVGVGVEKHCRFATAENLIQQNPGGNQIDHLVQDALNLECSHFIERIQQPSATLFSRPIAADNLATTDDPSAAATSAGEQVSRSGILKLVKQNSSIQYVDKK